MTAPAGGARRPVAAFTAWTAVPAMALGVLSVTGAAGPGPAGLRPGDLRRWVDAAGPGPVCVCTLRWAVSAIAVYLLVTAVLGGAARLGHRRRLLQLADRLTLPALRHVLDGVAAASLVMALVGPGTGHAAEATPAWASSPGPPTLHAEDSEPPTPAVVPSTSPPPTLHAAEPETDATPPPPPETEPGTTGQWTIAPGDHLWHVSESTLATRLGRPPSAAETATYLHRLIEANGDRLVSPGHPDLVLPGQVFDLPGDD